VDDLAWLCQSVIHRPDLTFHTVLCSTIFLIQRTFRDIASSSLAMLMLIYRQAWPANLGRIGPSTRLAVSTTRDGPTLTQSAQGGADNNRPCFDNCSLAPRHLHTSSCCSQHSANDLPRCLLHRSNPCATRTPSSGALVRTSPARPGSPKVSHGRPSPDRPRTSAQHV
jgi:hypothetical protein